MKHRYGDRALRTLGARTQLVSTQEARAVLGITCSAFTRLRKRPGFPPLIRDGRRFLIEPQALSNWAAHQNRLAAGLSLSRVARQLHLTRATLRAFIGRGEFPPSIGTYYGVARWDRHECVTWLDERQHRLASTRSTEPLAERSGG